jgi:hypothetical protein
MKVTMPTGWEDVTVRQYLELKEVPELGFEPFDAQLRILQILTGISDESFLSMPISAVKKLTAKTDFLNKMPRFHKKFEVKINGRRFKINYLANALRAGEYIDLMNITKDGKVDDNIVKILAILLKPVNWWGGNLKGCYKKTDDGKYIQTAESRRWTEENIPDHLNMDVVIPISNFFLKT